MINNQQHPCSIDPFVLQRILCRPMARAKGVVKFVAVISCQSNWEQRTWIRLVRIVETALAFAGTLLTRSSDDWRRSARITDRSRQGKTPDQAEHDSNGPEHSYHAKTRALRGKQRPLSQETTALQPFAPAPFPAEQTARKPANPSQSQLRRTPKRLSS